MPARGEIEAKNKVLRGALYGVGRPVDMADLVARWDALVGELQQRDKQLDELRDGLASGLQQQVAALMTRVTAAAGRWADVRPSGVPGGDVSLATSAMQDMALRWVMVDLSALYTLVAHMCWELYRVQQLLHEGEHMASECASFGMPDPDLGPLSTLWNDIQNTQRAWAAYFEFHTAVQDLGDTSWYAMRDRLWHVEEFVNRWAGDPRVGQASATPAVIAILKVGRCFAFYAHTLYDIDQRAATGSGYIPTGTAISQVCQGKQLAGTALGSAV